MDLERWTLYLNRRARPATVAALGLALLAGQALMLLRLHEEAESRRADLQAMAPRLEDAETQLGEARTGFNYKAKELQRVKSDLSRLARSKRTVYELGLQLQEERRLVEKQWEILFTYLMLDKDARKMHLMRGEQFLESYPIQHAPPKAFGDVKPLPALVQITSKERFAHPERGRYEEENGKLQWEPPQVGASPRANALGEYVMFTNSALILHGPPKSRKEHDAYPHYCLGLSLGQAKRLYARGFIGMKLGTLPPEKSAAAASKSGR